MKTILLLGGLLATLSHVCVAQYQINANKDIATSILHDQIDDYAQQIAQLRSVRTYEEGLTDGIKNAKNIEYMRGYHAATKDQNVFSSNLFMSEK